MTRYPYPYPFQSDEEPRSPLVTGAAVVLLILLAAVVIFILPRRGAAPPAGLSSSTAQSLAANPELGPFRRYQQSSPVRAAFLFARDPLLGAYELRQRQQARLQATAYLAQNPEVRLYERYLTGNR